MNNKQDLPQHVTIMLNTLLYFQPSSSVTLLSTRTTQIESISILGYGCAITSISLVFASLVSISISSSFSSSSEIRSSWSIVFTWCEGHWLAICSLPRHLKQALICGFLAYCLIDDGIGTDDTFSEELIGVGVDLGVNEDFLTVVFLCSFSSLNNVNW